jgi:ATP-binding cassette, subfamily C (CFTR/MRP), member 1
VLCLCQYTTKDTLHFLSTFSSVIGTLVALVFYTFHFPYLGIIFLPMEFLYYIVSVYYRRSSVEAKRLDSILRSILYESYSGSTFLLVILDFLSDRYP